MRPVPLPDGSRDPRCTAQRRADAFGQIIRTYVAGSERPTSGGVCRTCSSNPEVRTRSGRTQGER
ncbi:hypothetical protein [Gordonia spumicola]|uniref:hypothetical protein n=1 Tax=Gordonia spumicola TaxID=589161 RepID=UPI00225DFF19|nr:hypothetical protein [Gordonia spumicola]